VTSTRTRNQSTAPWTATRSGGPTCRGGGLARARGPWPGRVGTAVARLPVRVRLPDGSPHGGGDADAPVMHIRQPRSSSAGSAPPA
jgi:hypothetical protein